MSLAPVLDRAARRMGLASRVARASWLALAGVVVAECGALAARGLGSPALSGGAIAGISLLVGGVASLVLGRDPDRSAAARALDERLGTGALLETAAQARGPFAAVLEGQALARVGSLDLRALVPVRAPRGLALGAASALILLALALGPATASSPFAPDDDGPRIVLGGPPGGASARTPGKSGKGSSGGRPDRIELVPAPPSAAEAGASPAIDPALAKRIEERLRELAPLLAARPATAWSDPARERAASAALEEALARGDGAQALSALEALQASGTSTSAELVRRAAEKLGEQLARGHGRAGDAKPGEGVAGAAGAGAGDPSRAGTGGRAAGARLSDDPDRLAVERPSWRIREAEIRYRTLIE